MISGFIFLLGMFGLHNACKTFYTHTAKDKIDKAEVCNMCATYGTKGKSKNNDFQDFLQFFQTLLPPHFHYLVPLQTLNFKSYGKELCDNSNNQRHSVYSLQEVNLRMAYLQFSTLNWDIKYF